MSAELKIEDLEKSLSQRAHELADEYIQRAKRSHDHFIEDENERLQLREEKEIMAAKMEADRTYRSRVQSSELQAQKKLDQLRWQLIKDVIAQVKKKLTDLLADKTSYQELLIKFIQQSSKVLDTSPVIVELNQNDYQQLQAKWTEICQQLDSQKTILLSPQTHSFSGGVIVYNQDRSCRIDNSFEGRMERFSEQIHQQVAEQFFSELSHEGDKIHGR